MNWIRIARSIKDDPSIGLIAGICRVRVSESVGLVVCLLAQFPEHARDGDISRVPDASIEQWAGWQGKAGLFAKAIREQLCTADGVVRSWEKYNGAALREADRSIERSKNWRKSKKRPPEGTPSHGHTDQRTERGNERGNERGSVAVANAVTNGDRTHLRDVTRRNEELSTTDVVESLRDDDNGERNASQREQFTEPRHRDAFDGYLRAAQFPSAFLAEIDAVASGLSGPGGRLVPWPVIGEALHDMRVAGVSRFRSSVLRAFVTRIATQSDPPRQPGAAEPSFDDLIARIERGELLPHGT